MAASYKKLWKLLIDKDMRKEDLRLKAGITTTAMAKLGRNETVHMDILFKICHALDCGLDDILEIVSEGKDD
ncbi:MAG: helix-turn-helix domain-containing protein [Clostridia bacterium]|nr:helix-turn-helix domain-containing protein [Clostridia bacterium]